VRDVSNYVFKREDRYLQQKSKSKIITCLKNKRSGKSQIKD